MPGFMGIRGLQTRRSHSTERERRDTRRDTRQLQAVSSQSGLTSSELRSQEKVQEVLRGQAGDMSAFTAKVDEGAQGDCAALLARPISSIMSGRVAVLAFDDTLLTVQGIFSSVRFRHLPVVDDAGRVIGIVSNRDFLRTISPFFGTVNEQTRDKEIMLRKVGTVMTRNPVCAEESITVFEAVKIMNSNKIPCLPIVEGEGKAIAGIVTWKDVVRLFCPAAFNPRTDTVRLKAGVEVTPKASESTRRIARAAESTARQRAATVAMAPVTPAMVTNAAQAAPPPASVRSRGGDTVAVEAPKRET